MQVFGQCCQAVVSVHAVSVHTKGESACAVERGKAVTVSQPALKRGRKKTSSRFVLFDRV